MQYFKHQQIFKRMSINKPKSNTKEETNRVCHCCVYSFKLYVQSTSRCANPV